MGLATTIVELRFPAPNRPLSQNEANRLHWAARRGRLMPWREEVTYAWLGARNQWEIVKGKPCTIEVLLPFPDRRRRDGHNYTSTVVKAMIDALVMAGLCPDDTAEWIEVRDPILVVGKECVVRLIPR